MLSGLAGAYMPLQLTGFKITLHDRLVRRQVNPIATDVR